MLPVDLAAFFNSGKKLPLVALIFSIIRDYTLKGTDINKSFIYPLRKPIPTGRQVSCLIFSAVNNQCNQWQLSRQF
jgi:hypothetical protein